MKRTILFAMMIITFVVLLPPCQGTIEKEYEFKATNLIDNYSLYS